MEAFPGKYPSKNLLNIYNLNISSGSKKAFDINVETKYEKGHEFCLYDVSCKLQNNFGGNLKTPIIGFQHVSSNQFPNDRIKTISMDEQGRDINRYKIKSENEIDLKETESFIYGSILQYQCGPGKSFAINKEEFAVVFGNLASQLYSPENHLYKNLNISCEWDGNWSIPRFVVPKCVCK